MSEIEDAVASCFEQNLTALDRDEFPPMGPAHKSAFWVEDDGEIRLITARCAPGKSRVVDCTMKE